VSEYLLIHGGVHDRSCWNRLIPALECLGHRPVAALQQPLAERAGAAFQTIDADHSPFFSAVDELAARLHEAGEHLRNLPD
jgi:hypothetical protein